MKRLFEERQNPHKHWFDNAQRIRDERDQKIKEIKLRAELQIHMPEILPFGDIVNTNTVDAMFDLRIPVSDVLNDNDIDFTSNQMFVWVTIQLNEFGQLVVKAEWNGETLWIYLQPYAYGIPLMTQDVFIDNIQRWLTETLEEADQVCTCDECLGLTDE